MRTPDFDEDGGSSRGESGRGWSVVLVLALWLAAVLFAAQFAVASAQELEPQASALGWILVVILLLGGMAIWGTSLLNHQD
jgi:hypothetical protein